MYNDKILLARRQQLRKSQTATEKLLWQKINCSKLGFRFFRQYSVGPYILDFYCPKKRLAIEIDGPSHDVADAKIYDGERADYLVGIDIQTIRFRNKEVIKNIDCIVTKIGQALALP